MSFDVEPPTKKAKTGNSTSSLVGYGSDNNSDENGSADEGSGDAQPGGDGGEAEFENK
jgi:hypothetical protein